MEKKYLTMFMCLDEKENLQSKFIGLFDTNKEANEALNTANFEEWREEITNGKRRF